MTVRDASFWPDRFQREIESHCPSKGITLWSLGSPSFLYQSPGATIFVDPYFGPTPAEAAEAFPQVYRATAVPLYPPEIGRADAVLSTHDHTDHCHEPTLSAFQSNTQALFIGPQTSTERMLNGGIRRERIRTVAPGDAVRVGDVEIRVFDSHDPDAPGAVTFLLSADGVTLFVSGDTRDGETLDRIGAEHEVDLALLAFGGFYMSHEQLLVAAQRLKPKVLLPFHWEVWRGMTGNPLELGKTVASVKPPFDVKLLQIGDRIEYAAS